MRSKKPSMYWTLFQLWRVWRRFPMLRLGQLVEVSTPAGLDLFYMHDEHLIRMMRWRLKL